MRLADRHVQDSCSNSAFDTTEAKRISRRAANAITLLAMTLLAGLLAATASRAAPISTDTRVAPPHPPFTTAVRVQDAARGLYDVIIRLDPNLTKATIWSAFIYAGDCTNFDRTFLRRLQNVGYNGFSVTYDVWLTAFVGRHAIIQLSRPNGASLCAPFPELQVPVPK